MASAAGNAASAMRTAKGGRVMTNSEKIRAMTDEELADFLDRWEMGSIDYSKTFCSWCKGQYNCRDDCLMDWLKKEAEI